MRTLRLTAAVALMVSCASTIANARQATALAVQQAPLGGDARLPPLPPAQIDNKLEIKGDDVKARLLDDRLSIRVTINGHGPYRFVVDSGADTSVIGLGIAQSLGLPAGTPATLNATTERKLVERVQVERLGIGPTLFTNLELPALRETDIGADGVLGIDALAEQRLMLDFDNRTVRIEDARIKRARIPGEIVIVARRRRGQLILTQIDVAGQQVAAIIDTGSQVTIGNLALRNRLVRGSAEKLASTTVLGVTGASVPIDVARIDEIHLGPAELKGATIAFADVPPFEAFGLSKSPALLLGTDLLAVFKQVALDFRARKVRFQLKSCKSTEVLRDRLANQQATRVVPFDAAGVCG